MDNSLVIGDEQVEAGIAGMGSKRFYQLFHDRWDRGISNHDNIEWAEVIDDVEGTSILFYDTKPSRMVSGIGWFICTRHYFVMDKWRPGRMGIFL
jgi:hypothetical protein